MHWGLELERGLYIQHKRAPKGAWNRNGLESSCSRGRQAGSGRDALATASTGPDEPRELHGQLRLKLESEDKLEG